MEEATGVSAEQLKRLRPGLTSIRQKLRLASTRHTTFVEDAAYSLLGIFSVSGMHAIYGEREDSLGRLLTYILGGSGDTRILAWTGEPSNFNSFLPAHITVFSEPATFHLPRPIPEDEMERTIATSQGLSFDLDAAVRLYDRLNELPPPWFVAQRMKLPCIAFKLPPLTPYRTRHGRLYRADSVAFGIVDIKTRSHLSLSTSLYLIHPWLDAVLGRGDIPRGEVIEDDLSDTDMEEIADDNVDNNAASLPELELLPLPVRVRTVSLMDKKTHARRLAARLRQPFGALLVAPASEGRPGRDYMRVATDSLITVRFQENVSLIDLLDNVCTIHVL